MTFILNTVRCAAVLVLASGGLAQADLVVSPNPAFKQAFVNVGASAPFAQGFDGDVFASASAFSSATFSSFDADRGVLVGASFSLALDKPDSLWLRTYAPERGAKSVTASFSAGWQILGLNGGAAVTSAAMAPMISYASSNDAGVYGNATQWASTGFLLDTAVGTDLNGLVGASGTNITSRLDSALLVTRVDADKTKNVIQAYLTDSTGAAVYGALSGAAEYRYLEHASASVLFDQIAIEKAHLSRLNRSTLVTIVAQGSAGVTTGLEFSGNDADVSCEGDCGKFFARFGGGFSLAAGGQTDDLWASSIELLDVDGAFHATYTVTLHDAAAIGASDSQRTHWLSFSVDSGNVSAVPEPTSLSLALLGLGALGWLTHRRQRAGGRAERR